MAHYIGLHDGIIYIEHIRVEWAFTVIPVWKHLISNTLKWFVVKNIKTSFWNRDKLALIYDLFWVQIAKILHGLRPKIADTCLLDADPNASVAWNLFNHHRFLLRVVMYNRHLGRSIPCFIQLDRINICWMTAKSDNNDKCTLPRYGRKTSTFIRVVRLSYFKWIYITSVKLIFTCIVTITQLNLLNELIMKCTI